MFNIGGLEGRSLRRRGQRLVVVGALLGALIGVGLALVMEDAGTRRAVAAPERGEVLAISRPSSQPPVSRTADAGNGTAGNDTSGGQPVESADRSDKGHGKARKEGEGRQDKPGKDKHRKGEPGKGKDK